MVQFAVQTPQDGYSYHDLVKLWQKVEEAGFDSVWVVDHLVPVISKPNEPELECWTLLSALATQTKRIQIGQLVTCNTFRNPGLLAKMAATVDVISGGRLIVGMGTGYFVLEHDMYGIPLPKFRERAEMLREAAQVVKKLWTEKEASFKGRYYQIDKAVCEPKPVQKPHPPLLIGGIGEKIMLRIVAEHADIYNLGGAHAYFLLPEEVERKRNILEEHCLAVGRNPKSIQFSFGVGCIIAKTRDEYMKKAKAIRDNHHLQKVRQTPMDVFTKQRIAGTPEDCVESIHRFMDAGVANFLIYFPELRQEGTLDLFVDKVLSQFKK